MTPYARILLATFAALLLTLCVSLFGPFLSDVAGVGLSLLGVTCAVALTVTALALTMLGPTLRRGVASLCSTVTTVLVIAYGLPAATSAGRVLFFANRRVGLERFAHDALAYRKIREMSDGQRFYKTLNGTPIAFESNGAEGEARASGADFPPIPLTVVLARDNVDFRQYDAFRRTLVRLGFIGFVVTSSTFAVLRDGVLDRQDGYLLVLPGARPPAIGSELFNAGLRSLQPLGNGWFRFATGGAPVS